MAFDKKTQGKKTQNSRKKLKTQEKTQNSRKKTQNSRKKTQYFGFFKNISKASYLTSRRLCYRILNVERNKKLKTEKTQEKTQNSRKN